MAWTGGRTHRRTFTTLGLCPQGRGRATKDQSWMRHQPNQACLSSQRFRVSGQLQGSFATYLLVAESCPSVVQCLHHCSHVTTSDCILLMWPAGCDFCLHASYNCGLNRFHMMPLLLCTGSLSVSQLRGSRTSSIPTSWTTFCCCSYSRTFTSTAVSHGGLVNSDGACH